MSSNPGPAEPEYLGTGPAADDEHGPPWAGAVRRARPFAAVSVAVLAAVGAGAYGVVQLLSGGPSPAVAVPADAVGYVSLDLDPSAAQKIEAVGIVNKFPALRDELRLANRGDVRRAVFDLLVDGKHCDGLDYEDDVEPWIGDRVALAAVPDIRRGALPLLVLQIDDEVDARAGVRKVEACRGGSSDPTGVAIVDDYLLLADTQEQADAAAESAEEAALADDSDYTTAMERVGEPGIVTMYVSRDAPGALTRAQQAERPDGDTLSDFEAQPDVQRGKQLQRLMAGFEGAAGVIRFDDGAVELEVATKGLPDASARRRTDIETLPATTAAALALTFRDGWARDYVDLLGGLLGGGRSTEQLHAEVERTTGLRLPEDLESLFGDGLTASLDAGTDTEQHLGSGHLPFGVRIQGDPAHVRRVVDKLERAAGPDADPVEVATGDGVVTVGLDKE
jgi:hypothetical protein